MLGSAGRIRPSCSRLKSFALQLSAAQQLVRGIRLSRQKPLLRDLARPKPQAQVPARSKQSHSAARVSSCSGPKRSRDRGSKLCVPESANALIQDMHKRCICPQFVLKVQCMQSLRLFLSMRIVCRCKATKSGIVPPLLEPKYCKGCTDRRLLESAHRCQCMLHAACTHWSCSTHASTCFCKHGWQVSVSLQRSAPSSKCLSSVSACWRLPEKYQQ